jgi:flagellar motor protein MotB
MVAILPDTPKLEHRGYNRGLILGLTMAESMLLLVFCLLLVAAAMVTAEKSKRLQLERQLAAVQQEKTVALAKVAQLQSQLNAANPAAIDQAAFDKEWRELVAAREAVDRLAKEGLKPADLQRLMTVANALRYNGVALEDAPEEIKRMIANKAGDSAPHEWPPIINLSEAKGYFFQSGSAELTSEFQAKLGTSISDQIADNLARYKVDVIEVIGHTDEQPLSRSASNLDQTVIDLLEGSKPISEVQPADNAGLGLARAIAVANVLRSNPKLKDATVLPLSAAQLVLPGDSITTGQAGNVEQRRRIEIRVRRRSASLTP